MEGHPITRHFEFNRTLYSHQYPDIATASITGPEAVGDKLVYRFTRAIGTKG